jgi:hypothetical protein
MFWSNTAGGYGASLDSFDDDETTAFMLPVILKRRTLEQEHVHVTHVPQSIHERDGET